MSQKAISLSQLKTVHIIGACGTLMGSFAAFLKRRGITVTGSDQNVYPPMSDVLRDAGVQLFSGYSPENLTRLGSRPDLVVVGNVISASNPEARAAIDGGYRYSSLPEAMEQLMLVETRNLVVAGTHGKTTTASLLAHTLVSCGKDPAWFIGGVSQDLPFSFHVPGTEKGRPFVLEGDEYDTAFWDKVPKFNHYLPDDAILTSVEFDHADIYKDLNAVISAFQGLLKRIRPGGKLIACLDFAPVRDLIQEAKVPVITYGKDKSSGANYWPEGIHVKGELTQFTIMEQGRSHGEVALRIPGNHNVMNALAVWIECKGLGISHDSVARAFESFHGVKRRQEVRGEVKGVIVIDDFAHHPTAVRETVRALKSRYPDRKLTAVFEPRSATSRRKVFQADYVQAFCEADRIFIAKPFDTSKIPASDQFSSEQLVEDIMGRGKPALVMPDVESGVKQVAGSARSGDLIAVLSNGGFGGFIPKLLEELQKS